MTVEPGDEQPNMMAARASLFIPDGVEKVRAVLVFSNCGTGENEYENQKWRDSAAKNDYALLKTKLVADDGGAASYDYPEQSAEMLLRILAQAASESGHPEIKNSPFIHWGHSAGGFLGTVMSAFVADRAVAFVAFHGAIRQNVIFKDCEVRDKVLSEEFLAVPGLVLLGEYDPDNIRDSSVALTQDGRELDARWALAIERDAAHWDVESSRQIAIPFVEEVLDLRLEENSDTSDGPVELTHLKKEEGWMGTLRHHRELQDDDDDKSGHEIIDSVEIQPFTEYEGDGEDAQWLMSESFARLWLAYELGEE
ncbi:MAG: hypothetical protein GY854_10355 [Deltaproteobacteria bacterium]|nr:hypothetical protein [Deltaproteobacteria bacterium]